MNTELAKALRQMNDERFQNAYKACKGADPRLDVILEVELVRRSYEG